MAADTPVETRLFLAASAATTVSVAALQPGLGTQVMVLAPFVALLGVPHGALDLRIARALWPLQGGRALALFAFGYLGLAAAVLAVWWQAPGAALAAFLFYSAWHFGGDWRADLAAVPRFLAGVGVLGLPALVRPVEVSAIFAVLAPGDMASLAVAVMRHVTPVCGLLLAVLWFWCRSRPHPAAALMEWGALIGCALVLPPLMYFLVYFCFLHAPRHFLDALTRLDLGRRQGALAAVPLTLATWATAGIAFWLLRAAGLQPSATMLQVVFVGLAALAVPHMVLVERFWTRRAPW